MLEFTWQPVQRPLLTPFLGEATVLDIRLLGRFEVRRDGETVSIPSRASQSLFAYLLLNPGINTAASNSRASSVPTARKKTPAVDCATPYGSSASRSHRPGDWPDCFVVDELAVGLDPEAAYSLDVNTLKAPTSPAHRRRADRRGVRLRRRAVAGLLR